MENELIEDWINSNVIGHYGYGYNLDDGRGYGCGYGSGRSSRYGDGYGRDCGSRREGYGYGYGDSSGNGSGDGDGSGYGNGLSKFNEYKVYEIDEVDTIITNTIGNIAKGFIVKNNLTLKKCYIAKQDGKFAHGETVRGAMRDLSEKLYDGKPTEQLIEEFINIFKKNKKYSGEEFFKWHHILTGSCLLGRETFVKENNLDLSNKYSVKEFLEITKNNYGWSILKELEKHYKE